MLMKLSSALAACTLIVTSSGFGASGDNANADIITLPEYSAQSFGDCEIIEVDMPTPETGVHLVSAKQSAYGTDSGDSDFLERCRGIRWGYHDLDDRTNGELMMKIYGILDEFAEELWNKSDDVTDYEIYPVKKFNDEGKLVTVDMKLVLIIKDIDGEPVDQDAAVNTWFCYRRDNPIYYFYGTSVIKYSDGGIGITLADDEYFSGEKRMDIQSAVKAYLAGSESLVRNDYTRTDYQNSYELYKYVMNSMEYARDSSGNASKAPSAHNIVGGIVQGLGVCESYAKIYSLLLNYHGIDNMMITGKSTTLISSADHAWNMLKLDDGNYYCADPTFDDQVIFGKKNRYFAKGTKSFNENHTPTSSAESVPRYLFRLPEVPVTDFNANGDYRKTNKRLVDIDMNGVVNNLDLRALQQKLTDGSASSDVKSHDLSGDGKVNNRDIKALQELISCYAE